MPNLDFYAAGSDLLEVVAFVLGPAACRVFESYSFPGRPLREFETSEEVIEAFDRSSSHSVELMLYKPSMRGRYQIRRIELTSKAVVAAAPWRETIEGWV